MMFIMLILGCLLVFFLYKKYTHRFDSDFIKKQLLYEEARAKAKIDTTCDFSKLPIFPLGVPYDTDTEYRCGSYQNQDNQDPNAFMTRCIRELRHRMPDLLYMRGDGHIAADNKTKVLLAIEEVAKEGGELAVAALIVTKRGMILDAAIRRSCWPNTIHRNVPRRRHVSNLDWRGNTGRQIAYIKYFAPRAWIRTKGLPGKTYFMKAGFGPETEAVAESIAKSMSNIVGQLLRG